MLAEEEEKKSLTFYHDFCCYFDNIYYLISDIYFYSMCIPATF
jgi:hypothetical protein